MAEAREERDKKQDINTADGDDMTSISSRADSTGEFT